MGFSMAQVKTLSAVGTTADELKRAVSRLRIEVDDARRAGASWDSIGAMVGTTGEAARQRFGPKKTTSARGPMLFDEVAA